MKKYIAKLVKWNGETVEMEVKKEWTEAISFAVEGQFTFVNRKDNFAIHGSDFCHVDIYEVAA